MTDKIINKLPPISLDQVSSAYVGKPHKCMCGCSGKYFYPRVNRLSSSIDRGYAIEDNEVNDAKVKRIINKMIKHQEEGIEVNIGCIYTIIVGTRQYTLYIKDDPGVLPESAPGAIEKILDAIKTL